MNNRFRPARTLRKLSSETRLYSSGSNSKSCTLESDRGRKKISLDTGAHCAAVGPPKTFSRERHVLYEVHTHKWSKSRRYTYFCGIHLVRFLLTNRFVLSEFYGIRFVKVFLLSVARSSEDFLRQLRTYHVQLCTTKVL